MYPFSSLKMLVTSCYHFLLISFNLLYILFHFLCVFCRRFLYHYFCISIHSNTFPLNRLCAIDFQFRAFRILKFSHVLFSYSLIYIYSICTSSVYRQLYTHIYSVYYFFSFISVTSHILIASRFCNFSEISWEYLRIYFYFFSCIKSASLYNSYFLFFFQDYF